jgi:tetratricopeptide (TPR) repeat protein
MGQLHLQQGKYEDAIGYLLPKLEWAWTGEWGAEDDAHVPRPLAPIHVHQNGEVNVGNFVYVTNELAFIHYCMEDFREAERLLTENALGVIYYDFYSALRPYRSADGSATSKEVLADVRRLAYRHGIENHTSNDLYREMAALDDTSMAELDRKSRSQLGSRGIIEAHLCSTFVLLGRIKDQAGESEKALTAFQAALRIWRRKDLHRIERSDVLKEIGRFQFRQGNLEESRAVYQEAISLRKETATATHPNCADAIKGLADVSAAEGDLTSATLHAEESLKILDASVVPTHPRIAAELVALASIHELAGRPEQAAPLNERIETILQKPLGPWKEDFLDTTTFYAALLRKAAHPAAAERLDQLHASRKDKR